jgi:3-methyladenine DNA glycosylase AlkD
MSDRRVALHTWWAPLKPALGSAALRSDALAMQRYMKDVAPFFGVKTPRRRALLKAHMEHNGLPEVVELTGICRSAFAQPQREWHYCAVDLLQRIAKKLGPDQLALVEELITTKSWWDTVDLLASNVAGVILQRHRAEVPAWSERWNRSDDRWLVRTAILYQLKWKAATDQALLFDVVRNHAAHPDFFIRKGIGWALRSYAYTDPEAVRRFVAHTTLSPLSRREAVKHL